LISPKPVSVYVPLLPMIRELLCDRSWEAADIKVGISGMTRKMELWRHQKMAKYVIQAKRGEPPEQIKFAPVVRNVPTNVAEFLS
jgi:hypothetical protein